MDTKGYCGFNAQIRPTITMQANYYPSVYRNRLCLWRPFGFEGNFAGPQSPDCGRWVVWALCKEEANLNWTSLFSNEHLSDIEVAFRKARLVNFVFLGSLFVMGGFGVFLKVFVMGTDPGFIGLPHSTYSVLFGVLSLVSVVLAFFVLLIFPKQNSPTKLIEKSAIISLADLGQALLVVQMMRISFVQAIAIWGLILFFLNGELLPLFGFTGVALVLLVLIVPRWSDWEEARKSVDNEILN